MAKAEFAVSDAVRDVLGRSTLGERTLTLPTKLERKLYQATAKVIEGAGGRWSRKDQCHVFDRDPRELLGLAVATGRATNVKTALQAFYTPGPLAQTIVRSLDLRPGELVLEPSAGHGALALPAAEIAGAARVVCCEIDPEAVLILKRHGLLVQEGDFLDLAPVLGQRFDAAVMNPPFTGGQDVAHVTAAYSCLRVGGRLRAIVSAGVATSSKKATAAFRKLVAANRGTIEPLPDDSFAAAGTKVRTSLVSLTRSV